jgi:hypothetical protein
VFQLQRPADYKVFFGELQGSTVNGQNAKYLKVKTGSTSAVITQI